MLAFTVQFSRYGRNKSPLGASAPRRLRPFESASLSKAAASSGPNSVPGTPAPVRSPFRSPPRGERTNRRNGEKRYRIASAPLESMGARPVIRRARAPVLLRKEVIQPHLPVRLPCYDFVPIADPTFDSSLPCGLGRRLRVLPTFVT